MLFKDIAGQAEVKQSLLHMVQRERLPHANLFLGAEGSGGLPLALALGQYLLCLQPGESDACGHCSSCHKASRYIHPDLHFSFPTVGAKAVSENFLEAWRSALAQQPYLHYNDWLERIGAENRQGNITREECQRILQKLNLKTFEGRYKVLIMWKPELLGNEGNRLLKIIEEPPENTVIILVAEEAERILNTILSRCQITKVPPLPDESITEALRARFPDAEARIQEAAHLAQGDFGQALYLIQQKENDNAALFLDWMRKCYKGNGVELVNWVAPFAALGRERQKYFLQYALHFLREYLQLKFTGADQVRLRNNERQTAANLIKVIELDQAESMVEVFNECYYAIERNANPKPLFLDASIKLHRILKRKVPEAAT